MILAPENNILPPTEASHNHTPASFEADALVIVDDVILTRLRSRSPLICT
jgi:hypothetical protein